MADAAVGCDAGLVALLVLGGFDVDVTVVDFNVVVDDDDDDDDDDGVVGVLVDGVALAVAVGLTLVVAGGEDIVLVVRLTSILLVFRVV